MKILKWLLLVIGALVVLAVFVGMPYMRKQTKKHSPEKTATYAKNGYELSAHYSSPAKKGRTIFGELVPYGRVWRTGANEPTTFITTTDITLMDKGLPAGTYSLWTKPGPKNWTVIFNKEVPDWGVTLMSGGKETTRNAENDVLQVDVPSKTLARSVEDFTLEFQDTGALNLALSWDQTLILVPIGK